MPYVLLITIYSIILLNFTQMCLWRMIMIRKQSQWMNASAKWDDMQQAPHLPMLTTRSNMGWHMQQAPYLPMLTTRSNMGWHMQRAPLLPMLTTRSNMGWHMQQAPHPPMLTTRSNMGWHMQQAPHTCLRWPPGLTWDDRCNMLEVNILLGSKVILILNKNSLLLLSNFRALLYVYEINERYTCTVCALCN